MALYNMVIYSIVKSNMRMYCCFSGSISDFTGTVMVGLPTDVTFSVARTTAGQPQLTTFTLSMAGKPSPPIPVGATADEVSYSRINYQRNELLP